MKDKSCGLFVTGTDTSVGKTYVSRLIISFLVSGNLRVGVFKPFLTGGSRGDIFLLMKAGKIPVTKKNLEIMNPYFFKEPLAPAVASFLAKRKVNLGKVRRAFHNLRRDYDFIIAEGAGGLLVPVTEKKFIIDIVKELALPVVVVSRPGLGTINHTCLSAESLLSRGIKDFAVVINNYTGRTLAERTNLPTIKRLIARPVFTIKRDSSELPEDMRLWLLSKIKRI